MRMSKRRNKKITQKAFRRMAFSSALGILACIICLAGMTWAWFTDSVTSSGNTIESSHFCVEVTVTKIGNNTENIQNSVVLVEGTYVLEKGYNYKVEIGRSGNASKGYCEVSVGGTEYNTGTMGKNATSGISFTVNCTYAETDTSMIITPRWMGTNEECNLRGTITIGTETNQLTVNATAQALTSPQVNGTPNEAAGEGNNTEEKSGTEVTQTEGSETETGSEEYNSTGDGGTSSTEETIGQVTESGNSTETGNDTEPLTSGGGSESEDNTGTDTETVDQEVSK